MIRSPMWFMAVALILLSPTLRADEPHPLVAQVRGQITDPSAPFAMFVELTANPGDADALAELFASHTPASRAEAGNLVFAFHRDAEDRTRFVIYEQWKDLDALATHLATPHMQANLPRIQALTEQIGIRVAPLAHEKGDTAVLRFYTDLWVEAWSPGADDWDGEALRPLFADGPIKVFDNVEGGVVVLDSFDAYLAEWQPMMAGVTDWAIALDAEPEITVVGNMALVTFVFTGGGAVRGSGEPSAITQYGTHVWQRTDGVWKIIHEHLTADTATGGN